MDMPLTMAAFIRTFDISCSTDEAQLRHSTLFPFSISVMLFTIPEIPSVASCAA